MGNEFVNSLPAPLRTTIGVCMGIAVLSGTWVGIGGPIPATRGWVEQHIEERDEIARLQDNIFAINKALGELEDGDTRDALEEQLDILTARLSQITSRQ